MVSPTIRNWPSAKALGSLGLDSIWHNGHEFRHASAWVRIVDISSKQRHELPITRHMTSHIDFIPASPRSPKWGESGSIMQTNIFCSQEVVHIFLRVSELNNIFSFCSTLLAPLKLIALSLYIL